MIGENKKIMVADDDDGIVDAVTLMLEFNGYEVVSTDNGSNVTEIINKTKPDLLLLDIWMSGEDGKVVCKKLKSQESTKNIPVIMISASRVLEQSVLEAGADGFLAKPFEMDKLINVIEKYLTK